MKYKIQDLLEKVIDNRGKTPPVSETGHILLEINSLVGSQKFPDYSVVKKKVSDDVYNSWFRSGHPIKNDILIPTVGTLDAIAVMDRDDCCIAQNIIAFRINKQICDPGFLYYTLCDKNTRKRLLGLDIGGVQPSIKVPHLKQLEVEIPGLNTQQRISKILSSIDEKITLNSYINDNLYSLGKTLFKEKIDGNDCAEKRKLGSFFPVVTGKKDANAAAENGEYPFFTCSRQISRINEYTFDDSAILLAGNGDFNVKFYRGKFDAYQRTYVLIPEDKSLLGFLYWAISIKLSYITSNFRGSVIKFITKGNIEDYEISFVSDPKILNQFQSYLEMIEANNFENECLTKLRDTLLPELLNGKVDVSNIDI